MSRNFTPVSLVVALLIALSICLLATSDPKGRAIDAKPIDFEILDESPDLPPITEDELRRFSKA